MSLKGTTALLDRPLYGGGLRIMESLRLRVKNIDFDRHAMVVCKAKGDQNRVVMLPHTLKSDLWR